MKEVVRGLMGLIRNNAGAIEAIALELGSTLKIKTVLNYERFSNDLGSYPLLMPGLGKMEKSWVAAPDMVEFKYTIPLYGFVVHDDSESRNDMILDLAEAISRFLEREENQEIMLPGQLYKIHYHSDPPLAGYEFAYEPHPSGKTLITSFEATWVGFITRTLGWEGFTTQ